MTHVFISYSHNDKDFAKNMGEQLEKSGLEVWLDTDRLNAGDNWREEIDKAIEESYALIVIISANSSKSAYVNFEWAYGLGVGITIIPIQLESISFHPRLDFSQYLDFTSPNPLNQPWAKLIEQLENIQQDHKIKDLRIPRNASREIRESIRALTSWDPSERKKAAKALGQIRDTVAVPPLVTVLNDKDTSVAIEAALALGEIGDNRPLTDLCETLQAKDRTLAAVAAVALGKIGDENAIPYLIPQLQREEITGSVGEALGKLGLATIPSLLSAMNTDNRNIFTAVTNAIGMIGDKSAVPYVITKLEHPDHDIVKSAARTLGIIGDASAVAALVNILTRSYESIDHVAAKALETIGTPEALAAVEDWKQQNKPT